MEFLGPKKIKISNFEVQMSHVPQKKAENINKTDLDRKSKIFCKKLVFFDFFSIFRDTLEDPLKFSTFNFQKISKKFHKMASLGPINN